jgi:esterase/lipase
MFSMQLISRLAQYLRQVVAVGLIAIGLLLNLVFIPLSVAAPLTPESAADEIDQAGSSIEAGERLQQRAKEYKQELKEDANYTAKATEKAVDGSKNKLEEVVDTVVEKLNLNEPLPESTKEFLHQEK